MFNPRFMAKNAATGESIPPENIAIASPAVPTGKPPIAFFFSTKTKDFSCLIFIFICKSGASKFTDNSTSLSLNFPQTAEPAEIFISRVFIFTPLSVLSVAIPKVFIFLSLFFSAQAKATSPAKSAISSKSVLQKYAR